MTARHGGPAGSEGAGAAEFVPLDRVPPGSAVRVVHLACRLPDRLAKLSSFGVVPGATIELRQVRPALVFSIGETVLAVDAEIASEIFVSRLR